MTKQLNSYKGDQNFKQRMVSAIIEDKENERIVKGQYWQDGKGCNVGCGEYAVCQILGHKFENRKHKKLAEELEVPEAIFYLGDAIFEGLDVEDSTQFVVDFYTAIPVGQDLKNVVIDIKIALLSDPQFGARQYAFDDGKAAIDAVIELLNRYKIDSVHDQEWAAARLAAQLASEAAADSATDLAADSAVAWATWASEAASEAAAWASDSAAWASEAAADSAADSAAWAATDLATCGAGSAAREAAYKSMAKKLIELLSNATTPSV